MNPFRLIAKLWRWIVAEIQALSTATVNRRITGAPSSNDPASSATSLVFSVSALTLDALGSGGAYTADVIDQRGNIIVPDTGPAYESSDPSIFTVDPVTGAITAVAQGTAVLIARLGTIRPGLFTVTVRQIPTAVDVPGSDPSLTTGSGMDRVAGDVAVDGDDSLTTGTGMDEVATDISVTGTGSVETGSDHVASDIGLSPSGEIDLELAA